ncbi:FAST kinase domain-containing protein 3, mitochondrial isoform X2 [Salminus brasiliensis]|uniref:FAST kinase domain-containing protein 3, mitochondrial isoform X2 n=1 Tax=Salminus brasiliensis TaxID=930266 RepID=UPI003B832CA3
MALMVLQKLHVLRNAVVPLFFSPSIWTSSACRQLLSGCSAVEPGRRWLCITSQEPAFLVSGSVQLSRYTSVEGHHTSSLHRLSPEEDHVFKDGLSSCTTSEQVLRLVRSSSQLSGASAASVLQRLADLEQDGAGGLRDPAALLSDTALVELCLKLQKDSAELEDEVVIQALVGCTRLYLDPQSRLVLRLVSESQVRLDRGCLSISALCGLASALFALKGPDCVLLAQVMEQLKNKDLFELNTDELTVVYGMLAAGVAESGRYQNLLNKINRQAVSLTPRMDPGMVSKTLDVLVTLRQARVLKLLEALCKQAVCHLPNFTDAELAVVLSALMHYKHRDSLLVEALERHVPNTVFNAEPETITRVMQYLGHCCIISPPVFDAVAESFVYRADEYSTTQISHQIEALGVVGYVPQEAGRFFRKVESVLNARFTQFQPENLVKLLYACALLQRYPLNFVSKVFNPFFLQELQKENSMIDHAVLAQLTQLYMAVKLECPFYNGHLLLPKLCVKSFQFAKSSLETRVEPQLYHGVKVGLMKLLGTRAYFVFRVVTPNFYNIDVEIKLDAEGYVVPVGNANVSKRQLLGKEAMKQRHLKLLGYEVVQIPYYEFKKLENKAEIVKYLHKKIFRQTELVITDSPHRQTQAEAGCYDHRHF